MKGPLLLVGLLALARLGSSTTTTRKATLASSTAKIGKTKTNSTTTSAHAITPPGVFAVIPTSAGQIGVNPVEDDLGPTTTYIGSVHSTDLSLISASDEVTHWLVGHTDYLTDLTVNPTSTTTVQVLVATATAASDGQSIGDVSILFSQALAQSLQDAAVVACQACNVGALNTRSEHAKRLELPPEAYQCLAKQSEQAISNGLFNTVQAGTLEGIDIELSAAAAPAVAAAFATVPEAQLVGSMILFVFFEVVITIGITQTGVQPAMAKVNLPKTGFGEPTKGDQNSGTTTDAEECSGLKTLGAESPNCPDTDCSGTGLGTCIVGSESGCPCLYTATSAVTYSFDGVSDLLTSAASILPSIGSMADPPPTITVTAGTASLTCSFNGKSSPTTTFQISVPSDVNSEIVELPIANEAGDWAVNFDTSGATGTFNFWQVNTGGSQGPLVNSGNGAPPNNQIKWTVPDGAPPFNTSLALIYESGNVNMAASLSGNQTCQFSCPNPAPSCATCTGGVGKDGKTCTTGAYFNCACEPVWVTQPAPPAVTNCDTALAASLILSCNAGPAQLQTNTDLMKNNCNIDPALQQTCQSVVTVQSTYQTCGEFNVGDPIVRGSGMDEKATCLNKAFPLSADFKYNS